MNSRAKKGVFWGIMIAAVILVFNLLHHLFGNTSDYAGRHQGRGPGGMGMGTRGGFGPHQMMNGPHHGGGFSWLGFLLFLIIAAAIIVLLVKWLRRKAKSATLHEFIDTPLVSSPIPVNNHNAEILDQWEKNLVNKKENG
jgi:hypothetical protein